MSRAAGMLRRDAGVITLTGGEGLDFLNRLSTNDLLVLPPLEHRTTVLLTEKAKIIDIATVINTGEKTLLLVVDRVNTAPVISWLENYIIMEDLQLHDRSGDYANYIVWGDAAERVLAELFPSTGDMTGRQAVLPGQPSANISCLFPRPLWKRPCFNLLLHQNDREAVVSKVLHHSLIEPAGDDLFEMHRIEQGIPAPGQELTIHANPLEARLRELISFTKGCYIGQEVVARLETYKKVQRDLRGVLLPDDLPHGEARAATLARAGQDLGAVTSSTWSAGLRRPIALAYVKSSAAPGEIDLHTTGGMNITGMLTELPFEIP